MSDQCLLRGEVSTLSASVKPNLLRTVKTSFAGRLFHLGGGLYSIFPSRGPICCLESSIFISLGAAVQAGERNCGIFSHFLRHVQ